MVLTNQNRFDIIVKLSKRDEPLAQLAEHFTFNERVWSSNLQWLTKNPKCVSVWDFYLLLLHYSLFTKLNYMHLGFSEVISKAFHFVKRVNSEEVGGVALRRRILSWLRLSFPCVTRYTLSARVHYSPF